MKNICFTLLFLFYSFSAEAGEVVMQFDFNQPENICNTLKSEGLQTQGWKPSNSFAGEFTCMTDLIGFGQEGDQV